MHCFVYIIHAFGRCENNFLSYIKKDRPPTGAGLLGLLYFFVEKGIGDQRGYRKTNQHKDHPDHLHPDQQQRDDKADGGLPHLAGELQIGYGVLMGFGGRFFHGQTVNIGIPKIPDPQNNAKAKGH